MTLAAPCTTWPAELLGECWGNGKPRGAETLCRVFAFPLVDRCRRGDLNPHEPRSSLGPQPDTPRLRRPAPSLPVLARAVLRPFCSLPSCRVVAGSLDGMLDQANGGGSMKRYHWSHGLGPRTRASGLEDDRAAAVKIAADEAGRLRAEGTAGWWVHVFDSTKPFFSASPPALGWETVYFDFDPRPVVDDPATQELKHHLEEQHRLVEQREGLIVQEDIIMYGPAPDPSMVVQLHDCIHAESPFSSAGHKH